MGERRFVEIGTREPKNDERHFEEFGSNSRGRSQSQSKTRARSQTEEPPASSSRSTSRDRERIPIKSRSSSKVKENLRKLSQAIEDEKEIVNEDTSGGEDD